MSTAKSSYTASDIEVLEGLEPVRRRPGMYIGGTDGEAGLHHLVREIVDNAVDEAMNGHADTITVTLSADRERITVQDNGRGIPVDLHPKYKKPALELILTTLHSGGKFSDRNYMSAGGLHGVGSSVVNALSKKMEVTVWRDGYTWDQTFSRGSATSKLKKGDKAKQTGTRVSFIADDEIFKTITFSSDKIDRMIQEKAFLNKGVTLHFIDQTKDSTTTYCYKDGIVSYLTSLLEKQKAAAIGGESFFLERANGMRVEVAFAWTEATSEKLLSYVNGIHTGQGGTHEDGFRTGLGKALRNYMDVHSLVPKGVKLTGDDFREGLVGVISVLVPGAISQLQFQGQTKDKLNNPEVAEAVDGVVRGFENLLNSKPKVAAALVERITLAAKARAAARAASQGISRKVGISHRLNLPGKLADCSSSKPEDSEVFIVEGDSAGGSAKQGRDRNTQAVLPLRGKVLNSFSAGMTKVQENRELIDLVSALGCGYGEELRLEKLRYEKVIILTDADADGMHIASLLMAFFFKFMRPLVANGHLYLGRAPLYRVRIGSGSKEDTQWVYTDEEKEQLVKKGGRAQIAVTRFKGLGEMNPETLWDTTLNPRKRNLLRVTLDNEEQVTQAFESILGKDAQTRFQLIQENAHRLEPDI